MKVPVSQHILCVMLNYETAVPFRQHDSNPSSQDGLTIAILLE